MNSLRFLDFFCVSGGSGDYLFIFIDKMQMSKQANICCNLKPSCNMISQQTNKKTKLKILSQKVKLRLIALFQVKLEALILQIV